MKGKKPLGRLVIALCAWAIIVFMLVITKPWETIVATLRPLADPVELLGYPQVIAVFVCIPFCIWYPIRLIQKAREGDITSPLNSRWDLRVTVIAIVLGLLMVIPRYQLGVRVDEAGYVKCEKPSAHSAKNSSRSYASSPELCPHQ